jgi:hypothetical protein
MSRRAIVVGVAEPHIFSPRTDSRQCISTRGCYVIRSRDGRGLLTPIRKGPRLTPQSCCFDNFVLDFENWQLGGCLIVALEETGNSEKDIIQIHQGGQESED